MIEFVDHGSVQPIAANLLNLMDYHALLADYCHLIASDIKVE
ncbi:hypothetical protein [Nitrosomonas communis]|nr:hypothetical protein [Nitrosomonas communis]